MTKLTKNDIGLWRAYTNNVVPLGQPIPPSNIRRVPIQVYWHPVLDLHGMTVHDAWKKCRDHIEQAKLNKQKKITVITGRSGQISEEFGKWIGEWGYSLRTKSQNGGGCWFIQLK